MSAVIIIICVQSCLTLFVWSFIPGKFSWHRTLCKSIQHSQCSSVPKFYRCKPRSSSYHCGKH